jgi:hypothetical protein
MTDEYELDVTERTARCARCMYAFLSQVISFNETAMERDYLYCRVLAACLRGQDSVERLDLGSEVELTHLRTQETFSGSVSLSAEQGELTRFPGGGRGMQYEPNVEPISQIVQTIPSRHRARSHRGDAAPPGIRQVEAVLTRVPNSWGRRASLWPTVPRPAAPERRNEFEPNLSIGPRRHSEP